ncbi:MAG: glycosyltransferase family 4 protein [Candidatus Sumerlaeota bacterium]|nr:glycosyltransferase family 4 protein [Candidatus Sumerlaeota bacterium]
MNAAGPAGGASAAEPAGGASAAGLPAVLHVDSGKEWRGGQAQALELLRGLRGMGVVQRLACPPGSPLEERAGGEGFEIAPIPMRGEWDLFAPRRIARAARAMGALLLHAHDSRAHGLCWRSLGHLRGARLVVTRRVDFAIGGNYLSRRKYRNPRTHYIAISSGVREVLVRGGVAPERVDVVPSGINVSRFTGKYSRADLLAEFGLPAETFVVGNIAALTDHKGQCFLIDAAPLVLRECPRARFFIVGEGELRGALERQIAGRALQGNVFLTGYRQDVEKFLAGFDLFVLSSRLEGLCTSLLDAQYFGVAAVATRVGGAPDVVEDGRNGLLVEPRDPAALAEAILRLWRDEPLRRRFGAEGRRVVAERFTAQFMVEGTAAVYRRLPL